MGPQVRFVILAVALSISVLVLINISALGYSLKSETTDEDKRSWNNEKDCREVYNANTERFECVNESRRIRRSPFLSLWFILFFGWMTMSIFVIGKRCWLHGQQYQHDSSRPQDWSLGRPVIGISTVSNDYSNLNPRTQPFRIIALVPPSVHSTAQHVEAPPEYMPPPSYNECVINMPAQNNQHNQEQPTNTKSMHSSLGTVAFAGYSLYDVPVHDPKMKLLAVSSKSEISSTVGNFYKNRYNRAQSSSFAPPTTSSSTLSTEVPDVSPPECVKISANNECAITINDHVTMMGKLQLESLEKF
ncbi:hypothetical protein Ocin01_16729 [Orchesella cincta]|uniref:Transmembrane protein n=1 Tax=Orchesella cincta TaxID=48709 RepID=A0A1D2MAE9_ORCCI|nr:hypothetical protein Ocin01_16729 [Orchesella cincta]